MCNALVQLAVFLNYNLKEIISQISRRIALRLSHPFQFLSETPPEAVISFRYTLRHPKNFLWSRFESQCPAIDETWRHCLFYKQNIVISSLASHFWSEKV